MDKLTAKEMGELLETTRNLGIQYGIPRQSVIDSMNQILDKYNFPLKVSGYTKNTIEMEPRKE